MNKILKITLKTMLCIVLLGYMTFLIAPFFINLESFKPQLQKIVKDSSKLNLNYSKMNVYTTPLLSAGINIDDLNLKLDDNSDLLNIQKLKGGIALPSLLTLTAKTSRIYIQNPKINLEIKDSKQYKIVSLIEEIINENNKKANVQTSEQEEVNLDELLKRVRIKVPYIKITNYDVNIFDNNTSHKLALNGEELFIKYNGARNTALVKTKAVLKSDDKENIKTNINISTSTPKISLVNHEKEELDPEESIKLPFINLIEIYQTYDLKANIQSHIRVRQNQDGEIKGYGFFNIDNINLKLSEIRLPDSYIHINLFDKDIKYDTNIYATKTESLLLKGVYHNGKHPKISTEIVADKIYFSNLLKLLKGLLDSLNINNDISAVKANGYIEANTKIKTNFKKLRSSGFINIKDGEFLNSKINLGIRNINSNLLFENNALDIKNTQLFINNSKVAFGGYINSKSMADIKVNTQNLSIPTLYNAFAPKELKKSIALKNANLTFDLSINGKLNDLLIKLNSKLSALNLSDTKNTYTLSNELLNFDLNASKEETKAKLNNKNTAFVIPSAHIYTKINNINISVNDKNITIEPFEILYNKASKIVINGGIENYLKSQDMNIFLDGSINTNDIKETLGKEASFYIPSKGNIPLKVEISGNSKQQDILAQIYADFNNFISPIEFSTLKGFASIIQADVRLKGNKIKIKNSGLFKKNSLGFSNVLEENTNHAKQLVDFTTIIDDNHINLLRINFLEKLPGKISIFDKSNFAVDGKLHIDGIFNDLIYLGKINITNLNIPELLFAIKDTKLDFMLKTLSVDAKEIDLNGSKLDTALKINLSDFNIIKINDFILNSNLIDVDKALEILTKLEQYTPKAPTSANTSAKSAQQNIPLILNGKININKLKTGEITVDNINSLLNIKNNNLYVNKLNCNAFKGQIKGDVIVNLLTQLITIKLNGNKVDANEALEKAANLKDTLSGTVSFKTDISLSGTTLEEQMRSLKGDVNFQVNNGQYGPFSKLENFFLAENIRENAFFKNTIGAILTPITTIDSSHFEELKGTLKFKDGIVQLAPITSKGNILCVLIQGDMDLLKNTINSHVRVRLASAVSDMLGPLALANPVNLIKNTPGLNLGVAKLFTFFTEVVDESEYKAIPDFSSKHSDKNATKFQIVLDGDVAKPLKLVKSFKWLVVQKDMDLAEEFSSKYVAQQEHILKQQEIDSLQKAYEKNNKVEVITKKLLHMDTTAPEVKDLLLKEILKTK